MNVAIPASATATVNVPPPASIPLDVCALGIHLMGTAPAGTVYSDAYVRVKENPALLQQVTDPAAIAVLNEAAAVTKDPNHFDGQELRELVANGKLSALPPAMGAAEAAAPPMKAMALMMTGAPPSVGQECTPGEESTVPALLCQPTADWVGESGQILNASKGHILMDHGCGKIGILITAINQNYSHDSVIAKNRVAVRHSTSSEDRAGDPNSIEVLALRLDRGVLQYGYPGTEGQKTHTIDEMVSTYYVTDPDGKNWRMGGELAPNPVQCDWDITAVPGLVVRPPPDAPADLQQAVASMADPGGSLFTTNGHYRFVMYSHADQAASYPGGDWAAGTEPTVCSSFAQTAASRTMLGGKALRLRPSVQQENLPDGMQKYTVEKRLAGAEALYANAENSVREKCRVPAKTGGSILGAIFGASFLGDPVFIALGIGAGEAVGNATCSTLASNIANQVTNCFAYDGCDDTSGTWKNPGTGTAVSPDNILDWDVPTPKGDGTYNGTYGYNEPFLYLPAVFRHKYVWVPKAGNGKLVVNVVKDDGKAAFLDNAQIYTNTLLAGSTGSTGTLEISEIAAGNYDVEAQYSPCAREGTQPLPPAPIDTLPACPSGTAPPERGCTVQRPAQCPNDYTMGNGTCLLQQDGSQTTIEVCACYPPSKPVCNQPPIRGSRLAVVKEGETTVVTINLCVNGNAACLQDCTTTEECDNSQTCTDGKCVAGPRKVDISIPYLPGRVQGDCTDRLPNASTSLHIVCDPTQTPNFTDWLCDGGHLNFCDSSKTGGVADAVVNLNGDGNCNAVGFHIVCTFADNLGGILVGTDVRMYDGCGAGKEDDERTAQQWKVMLTPAVQNSPNPPPLVCNGAQSVVTNSGTCDPFNPWVCFDDRWGLFDCNDACQYNNADLTVGITYQNIAP